MKSLRPAGLIALLFLGLQPAAGQSQQPAAPDAVTAPAAKIIGVPTVRKYSAALMVLNAQGAELNGRTLTLNGVAASAILFASHPQRAAGHLPTPELVDLWTTGSFAKDAPNATVSAFHKDGSGVSDAVVVLRAPKVAKGGSAITFEVDILEGNLAKGEGPVAVFIDTIWFGVGSGGFTYYGRSDTKSAGQDSYPAVGSPSQQQDMSSNWPRPSPDAPAVRPNYYPSQGNAMPNYNPGLAAPPDLAKQCGKPPLLPCY